MNQTATTMMVDVPTRDDAVVALTSVIRPMAKLIVVHSQIGAFGAMNDPAETLLEALRAAMPSGATLAMPVFSFGFLSNRRFDLNKDPSETGMLTETFRLKDGVTRSKHPVYSYAIEGPLAEKLSNYAGETCWGDDTIFAAMEEFDADIIMLGSSWEQCTLFHRIEQIASVPYRYSKQFSGTANFGDRDEPVRTEMLVRRLDLPVENNFTPIVEQLQANRAIRSATLGRGLINAASARDILKAGADVLSNDPLALLAYKAGYQSAAKRTRVALMSSANLDVFVSHFTTQANEWIKEGTRTYVPPFDQYCQEILNPNSDFYSFDPEWIFFLERSEDILGRILEDSVAFVNEEAIKSAIEARIRSYTDIILQSQEGTNAQISVMNFSEPANSPLSMADKGEVLGQAAVVLMANKALAANLADAANIQIVDFATIAATFGRANITDQKYWHLGRIPFSRNFSLYLAQKLVGTMLAISQRGARLIISDLDNTLWKGVIGEDGVESIGIGTDFPGNAFRDFQIALKALGQRGIALAICSKNTEETALSAFSQRPEMVLKEDDFVAKRINWKDKARNIREIADEMALGLGSICFIDDDPHERALVRQQLPEVFVPSLPEDPSLRANALLSLPCLELLQITNEDFRRTEQYKARAAVVTAKRAATSLEDFYRDLSMTLSFESMGTKNQARMLQLVAKTNQFNTTSRRYTIDELRKFIDQGAHVLAIGLTDRYSEREIIGVIIVLYETDRAVIDLFLLSCRVLGRSVESGILGWIADKARTRGVGFIDGLIVETKRNQPARPVFTENGFVETNPGQFRLKLSSNNLTVSDWFVVEENLL
jgi:FkbH-like protein